MVSISQILLKTNGGKNLMTEFSANNQNSILELV